MVHRKIHDNINDKIQNSIAFSPLCSWCIITREYSDIICIELQIERNLLICSIHVHMKKNNVFGVQIVSFHTTTLANTNKIYEAALICSQSALSCVTELEEQK